jgi:soluble lytic murein transglycosylase-like protein
MYNRGLLFFFGILTGSVLMVLAITRYLTPIPVQAHGADNAASSSVENTVRSSANNPTVGCPLSPNYPSSILQWCDKITRNANLHGIDPNLIAALILQESGGQADAYSKSGAVGLMQVMPRDGLAAEFMCPNGPCFANRPSMAELYDPDFNVEYGTQFLASLISRHGSYREALKYYGPANVDYYYADIVMAIYEKY